MTRSTLLPFAPAILCLLPAAVSTASDRDAPERPGETVRLLDAASEARADQPRRRPPFGAGPRGPAPRRSEPTYGLSFHSGFRMLGVESGLFDDNEYEFGVTPGDFLAARFGVEGDFAVLPRLAVTLGFESGSATRTASYLDFVHDDGAEIVHDAELSITEFNLGARLLLGPPTGRVRGYLTAGVTGMIYEYWEDGEFLDGATFDIFYDHYRERSFQLGFFGGVGGEMPLFRTRQGYGALFVEYRYATSRGEHGEGFEGYGDLRVDRSGALVGLRVRF